MYFNILNPHISFVYQCYMKMAIWNSRNMFAWLSMYVDKWRLVASYQLNVQFLYSITICMLHYNPRHVSSSTMLIFRRTNCIITASGIFTLCKRPCSMPVESGLQSALNRPSFLC